MKKYLVIVALITSTGCGIPASIAGRSTAKLTTPGINALHATGIGRSLDIVRDIAVSAEQTKNISTDTMLKVVKAHKSIALTLDQLPNGWQTSVEKGLTELESDLTPSERTIVGPYIDATLLIIKAVS